MRISDWSSDVCSSDLGGWTDRLAEADVADIGVRTIQYELGYPRVLETEVAGREVDVLTLRTALLSRTKFRAVMTARYPILLVDEDQDTDAGFVDALKQYFLDTGTGPVVGLFGDHWQKIYGEGCGAVDHAALEVIDKNANFRSAGPIVSMLNRMRPALPPIPSDADVPGEARSEEHTSELQSLMRISYAVFLLNKKTIDKQ